MKRRKLDIFKCALALLMAAMAWACSSSSPMAADEPEPEPWDGTYYLSLYLRAGEAADSRAGGNPSGGENGDGVYSSGINNENKIYDATLLIYGKSLNSGTLTTDDRVLQAVYFDDFTWDNANSYYHCTVPLPFELANYVGKTYYIAVVANCGDMTPTFLGMSLPALADYKMPRSKSLWQVASGAAAHTGLVGTSYDGYLPNSFANYDRFAMSSYSEASFEFEAGKLTFELPTITLHRMAARIDVGVNSSYWNMGKTFKTRDSNTDKGIEFVVYRMDPETKVHTDEDSGERYLVTGITVNKSYTGNQYLLKHTADNTDGDNTEYMGRETSYSDGNASNFVLMPSHSSSDYASFGFSCVGQLQGLTPAYSSGSVNYYGLCYTRENVNDASNCTGITLKGYYQTSGTKVDGDDYDYTHAYERDYAFTLRHSDPAGTGTASDPMHFAIVRNNLYRVYIDNVYSDQKYVYVRYYYYRNNGNDEVDYTDVKFEKVVQLQPSGDDYPDD